MKIPCKILRSENGVGIMEALVVTVIVAMSAVAFLTLQENQGIFLKRTRQVNTRDQLGNFFHGVVQDRGLFLFSAQHEKNSDLRDCLGNPARGIPPSCAIGKPFPLWLTDLTDPNLKKVWTAPPEKPALFDESGQGCGEDRRALCRFEASTTFTAYCAGARTDCKYPTRFVVNLSLKQLYSQNQAVTPLNLKPVQYTHAHLIEYNQPPKFENVPQKLWLSSVANSRSVVLSIANDKMEFPLVWHACDSSSPDIMVQCLEPTSTNSVTATIRLATSASGKTHKVRFQIANLGPAPNSSEVIEIPVSIEPVCITPWGQTIQNGITVTAFNQSTVGFNEECKAADITCVNGSIGGTGKYPTCTKRTPIACQLPWAETLQHGSSRVAFGYATVPFGSLCPQETRTCNDGILSGSAQFQNCSIQTAAICTTPWGAQVQHGNTVVAFSSATVDFGKTCDAQVRMCNNGILSGTASIQNCAQALPRNCTTPWGASVSHGTSVDAYSRSTVPFGQSCNVAGVFERRLCSDGTLLGSFPSRNCNPLGP
jgi:hypothetical protein